MEKKMKIRNLTNSKFPQIFQNPSSKLFPTNLPPIYQIKKKAEKVSPKKTKPLGIHKTTRTRIKEGPRSVENPSGM